MTREELQAHFSVHKLTETERVTAFDCGDDDLNDFIKHYFVADNKTGCRFITVDAYAAAIPFYLKNGFVPLNDEEADEPTRLLYFDLNDLNED